VRFSEEIRRLDHTNVLCAFHDETGRDRVLHFACSLERETPDEIVEYVGNKAKSGLQQCLFRVYGAGTSEDFPNRVVDFPTIAKARLKGRFKGVITKDGFAFRVDFLRGNLFIDETWAKTVGDLPRNSHGIVSIDLKDLARPDEKGVYSINGEKREISHREALKIIVDKMRTEIFLPDDFEDRLIALAEYSEAFIKEILMDPLPWIHENHPILLAIDKKLKSLRDAAERTSATSHDWIMYSKFQQQFNAAISPLYPMICGDVPIDERPQMFEEASAKMTALYRELI